MPTPATHTLSLHDALPIPPRPAPTPATSYRSTRRSGTRRAAGPASSWSTPTPKSTGRTARTPSTSPVRTAPSRFARPTASTSADRKSTRLNSSHMSISYADPRDPHSFPTRRSSDPAPASPDASDLLPINTAIRDAASRWPSIELVDTDAEVDGPDGSYAEYLPGPDGPEQVRKADGLHFCRSEEHTSELQSHVNLVCRPPRPTLFPYTTLFRSRPGQPRRQRPPTDQHGDPGRGEPLAQHRVGRHRRRSRRAGRLVRRVPPRSGRPRAGSQGRRPPLLQIGRAHV